MLHPVHSIYEEQEVVCSRKYAFKFIIVLLVCVFFFEIYRNPKTNPGTEKKTRETTKVTFIPNSIDTGNISAGTRGMEDMRITFFRYSEKIYL